MYERDLKTLIPRSFEMYAFMTASSAMPSRQLKRPNALSTMALQNMRLSIYF